VRIGDNATVRLDRPNEPQPDALLRYENGTSRLIEEGYIEGPPELAFEISASSASLDLYEKREVYRRNGVQEYVVWRVFDGEVDWFELREGQYGKISPGDDGVIESRIFPGLRLLVPALVAGEWDKVLAVQLGNNS
jgi:Uma2 family endonuclease